MGVLLAGFLAGFLHVLAGPDHLAAVAPYAVEGRRRAWKIGWRWGFGHASGVVLVGLLALLLREALPVESLSSWSERCVGLVLVGIGLWTFHTALRSRLHSHEHVHDGERHVHFHVHDGSVDHEHAKAHVHSHAAFAVGTLHGLAGSSHLLGVLPALALPSAGAAALYLAAFGAGSIGAMAGFSSCLGALAGHAAKRGPVLYRGLLLVSAVAAVGIGGVWLFS